MSTLPVQADLLSSADYEARTREVLAAIESAADRLLQEDIVDIDAGRTGGLLELAFPNGSKIVVNTQPPLQELRPSRLSIQRPPTERKWKPPDCGRWIDSRDGREFFDVLSACASAQAGRPLRFER